MSKRITYSNGPIGDVKVVRDFLPAPSDLVFREEQVKVTIGLSKASVDFFKEKARRHHTQYQKMIRRLLDLYVSQHR
jgi:predicted DNA binding CopG/RHH family protein